MSRLDRMRHPSTSLFQPALPDPVRRLGPLFVAVPILAFSALLLAYTVNAPWMDDIDAFLSFILGYTDSKSSSEKVGWLLRPNNEHRILTAKLVTLALYELTGEVNFRWLILIAFGFLLGTLFLFYRIFRSMGFPLIVFAPVAYLLLQPQHYLMSMWAITGLQHQVIVFFTLAGLYLLANQERQRFVGATGLQIIASLSMSNGLFGWFAGAVVLALQRHWLRLGIWLAVGAGTIIFYFHDFPNAQGNSAGVSFFRTYPYLVVSAFFTFLGGLFDFFPNLTIVWRSLLPTLAGLLLVLTLVWLLWRMYEPIFRRTTWGSDRSGSATESVQKRRYFFTGCYIFLLINALVIAFLRPRFGYSVMLVSNYMLYPALLVSLLYLNLLSELPDRRTLNRLIQAGLVSSLFIWSASYFIRWPKVAYRKEFLLTNAYNQHHNNIGLGPTLGTPFEKVATRVMNETVKRGLYKYPDASNSAYERLIPQPLSGIEAAPSIAMTSRPGNDSDYSCLVETVGPLKTPVTSPSAVVIQSANQSFLFPSEIPYGFRAFWLRKPVHAVKAEVITGILTPGTYRVGALVAAPDVQPSKCFSSQQLTIPR